MQKEKLQIISLSAAPTFLDYNSIPTRNMQDQAGKLEKYILVNFQKVNYKTEKVGNILFIEIPRKKSIFYTGKAIKEIKSYLDKKIKTVITAGNPFDLGILGIIFKLFLGFPLQLQVHMDLFSKYFLSSKKRHYIYFLISKITFPLADSIRTVSKNTEQILANKYPKKLIRNIIEIADFSNIEVNSEKNKDGVLYLCPARYDEQKNPVNLVNAFIKFHKTYPDTKLKMIGAGPLKNKLELLIKENEAGDYIELPGWSKDIPNEYTKANYTILPSLFEGCSMVIIETMHYGTPLLATPFTGGNGANH